MYASTNHKLELNFKKRSLKCQIKKCSQNATGTCKKHIVLVFQANEEISSLSSASMVKADVAFSQMFSQEEHWV